MSNSIPAMPSALRLPALGKTALPKLKLTPAKNGAIVEHFSGGVEPGVNSPKRFVFPNQDGLLRHIARASRQFKFDANKLKGV